MSPDAFEVVILGEGGAPNAADFWRWEQAIPKLLKSDSFPGKNQLPWRWGFCSRSQSWDYVLGVGRRESKGEGLEKHPKVHSPDFIDNHPGNDDPSMWPFSFPYDTHEDEAEFVNEDSALIYSMSSSLSHGSSWLTRLVMAVIPVSWVIPGKTDEELKRFQCWSSWQLLYGIWPTEGYVHCSPRTSFSPGKQREKMKGHRLCGPWRGCFNGSKADEKQVVAMFKPAQYYLCSLICRCCMAQKQAGSLNFGNLSRDAPHRRTMIRHHHYMENLRDNPPAATQMPGFFSERVWFDMLHVLFVNGVGNDLAGSVLVLLCARGFYGDGSLNEKLARAWFKCKGWLRKQRVCTSIPKFTTNSLKVGDNWRRKYPWLSGWRIPTPLFPLICRSRSSSTSSASWPSSPT